MHQYIDCVPASIGYLAIVKNGVTKLAPYDISVLRRWEDLGKCRQTAYDTWTQCPPSPETLQREAIENVMVRFANNVAYALEHEAESILKGHPLCRFRRIFDICMREAQVEQERLQEATGCAYIDVPLP